MPCAQDSPVGNAPPAVPAPMALTRNGVRRGVLITLPLGLGSLVFGMAFGVIAGAVPALGDGRAIGMSGLVYSGAAQMASVDLIASQAGLLAIWSTTLLVSLRYVLLGLTTRLWFTGQPLRVRLAVPFVMSDEVWGLSHREFTTARQENRRGDLGFFLGSGLVMLACWTAGTAVGITLGGTMPDPAAFGIGFAATATFIALLAGMTAGKPAYLSLAVAGGVAIATERWLPGQWYILIGALAGLATSIVLATSGRRAARERASR
ncbi:MAG: AzlC family ABC transporter permease [Thermomicrobiales bacterium]